MAGVWRWQRQWPEDGPQAPEMSYHLIVTIGFFALGLTIVPRIMKRINKSVQRFRETLTRSLCDCSSSWILCIAGALDVSVVFAAFLAGFAVVHKKRRLFSEALDSIGKVSFAFFIPAYFAIVGLKLDLVRAYHFWMLAAFILGSCVVKILSVSFAGRLAGFRGLDLVNLAITTNARGGPGIVSGQRGIRCRNHQPKVLHDTGDRSGTHFANGGRMA